MDYLTQRTESLMALFFLFAMYAGIRAYRSARPVRWQTLAVLSCLAGAASKETIAVAPIAILFYDRVSSLDRSAKLSGRAGASMPPCPRVGL